MLTRLVLTVGIVLSLLAARPCIALAEAPHLFVEASAKRRATDAPPRLGRGETRKRSLRIDRAVVAARLLPGGADAAADRALKSEALPADLTIRFFDDAVATFRREAVEAAEEGGIVWTGNRTDGIGTLTLVVRAGRVTGTARLDARRFRLLSTGPDTAVVAEIELARLPPLLHKPVRLDPPKPFDWATFRARRPPVADASAVATIDLLVAYTPAAKKASANLTGEVRAAVANANRAFKDSGVKAKLRIVGWHPLTGFVERRGNDTLGETVSGNRFAALRKKRDAVGADLVSVVEARDDFCGIAYVLAGRTVDAAYGYSVISLDCLPGTTLAHEIGHNLGLKHDRFVEVRTDNGYNYGYSNLVVKARDVMSYPDECFARFRRDCAVPDVFSSPLVRYRGGVMGVAAGQANAADAARTIRSTAPVVSRFRRAP